MTGFSGEFPKKKKHTAEEAETKERLRNYIKCIIKQSD
jgi:hypothetical protein